MSKMGIGDIMKQAQDLQARLAKVQEEAASKTLESSSGGGMVSVTINGRLEILKIQIDPQVLEGGDVEMLQDLILAAVNQAVRNAQQLMAQEMSQLTGGLKIPGLT